MTHRRTVVVCDPQGNLLRTVGAQEAHQDGGVLHKAFSVFVFRDGGAELLLQRRSRHKALFALRWANTCCSHVARMDEHLAGAARRRLLEEFGFSVALREAGQFVYRAEDPVSRLTEYEHDTVLIGEATMSIPLRPDPAEIAEWRWIDVRELQQELGDNSCDYAPWLPAALGVALSALRPSTGQ